MTRSVGLRTMSGAWLIAALAAIALGDERGTATEDALARQLLDLAGVRGGLVVHLGCGDARLTAALRVDDGYLVHGLDADAQAVDEARRTLRSLGVYGRVSAERLSGTRLPYADNLVNLLVAEDASQIPAEEVLRVLVPNGVACIREGDRWKRVEKPRPGDIDEWTHFLHDAGNNAVAADSRVGPPRSLQWMAPPLWLRSHETPSGFEALVSGGGRVFYLLDEGLVGITDQRLPERWSLFCRDAFNGKLLWKRPLDTWGWPQWAAEKFQDVDWTLIKGGRTVVPNENQRRLVVDGDRLYATLGYRAPLAILAASSGQTLHTVAATSPARQLVAADGIVVVHVDASSVSTKKRRGEDAAGASGSLVAVRGSSGQVLWRADAPALRDLALAIDRGQVIYQSTGSLECRNLQTGESLWQVPPREKNGKTLVAHDGLVLIRGSKSLEAYDGASGQLLWHREGIPANRLGSDDLFVVDGVVWPGAISVGKDRSADGKDAASVVAVGYDVKTGEERQEVFAPDIISPEHHHRCYRNKATERYMITSMEGAEFLDLRGSDHSQNNFVRGACKLGMMPCNGLLYVPPDQCFCQPGAKQLGFTAISTADASQSPLPAVELRLERGPAFGLPCDAVPADPLSDWPTYRHDAARHGTTPARVAPQLKDCWRMELGPGLKAPVVVGQRVFAAIADTHTVVALDLDNGRTLWTFTAGGRIDSPPTFHEGRLLFGSADGWVYCLRADDGGLAWRFLAAPRDRRIVVFDQLESTWPVHGSVLVREGIAYATAGRSTYLDGGIRLYGLEPATGRVLHQAELSGPFPDGGETIDRDVSFYIRGANSDVLVSEGDAIYMRQKRLTPELREQPAETLSSKGESDVGLHVFSTAGLLDGSWYNRTFWMYAKRWPGFQLANQASKSGQLLVVDEQHTYGVNPFYRRNLHSPMFFPGKEGYLLFADRNENEPQIIGDAGARPPVPWLPQSDYLASSGPRSLDSPAFGVDKGIGYTRAAPPVWTAWVPVRARAMVKAGDVLFVAGPPDAFNPQDPYQGFEGRAGAALVALSARDGQQLGEHRLDVPPVFDGLIAARGRLLIALEDGSLICLAGE